MGTVKVVFCMDTEGPCDDPSNDELLSSWADVDRAMDKLFSDSFRKKHRDSTGRNFTIGWFFLTWSGFKTNPRGRDFGYHKVRDHYRERWGNLIDKFGDEECWHYHHPPKSGIGNEWSDGWYSSKEYKNIISRQILERKWFPLCFRAGGTIMDAGLSQWVDKWFPFDYSNRAPLKFNEMDWSDGVNSWRPYHPDPVNFKSIGDGRRYMTRCLDLYTGLYKVDEEDIINSFEEASKFGTSILSVFDHDYRDIEERIALFLSKVKSVSNNFPEITWEYSTPKNAIIDVTKIGCEESLIVESELVGNILNIRTNSEIHQQYPWIATKDIDGQVDQIELNIKQISKCEWNVELNHSIRTIGVAASSETKGAGVAIINTGI